MTQQVGSGNGSPTRWVPSVVDDADPTGGRHVLDKDAALTPIFTALRRGEWRPSPPPAARALRSVPVPDRSRDRSWDGPPTGPIPAVPPLHLVDPWSPGSFAAPAPPPPSAPPSPSAPPTTGATAWWSHADVRYPEPVAGPVPGHRPDRYAPAAFDDRIGQGTYDSGFHDPGFHDPEYADPRFHGAGSGDPRFHGVAYRDPRFHAPQSSRPRFYDPIIDTGRHHHRLAPAGW